MARRKPRKKLTSGQRAALKARVWKHQNPSMESYSDRINHLLDTLTDAQLTAYAGKFEEDEREHDEEEE